MKDNAVIGRTGRYWRVAVTAVDSHKEFAAFTIDPVASSEATGNRISADMEVTGPVSTAIAEDTGVAVAEAYIPVFPDRKSEIKAGVARVERLKPMTSKKGLFIGYAFAEGWNPRYEWPSDNDVAEWLAMRTEKEKAFSTAQVDWLETTNNGRLVRVWTSEKTMFLTRGPHEDVLCRELSPYNGELEAARDAFPVYPGVDRRFATVVKTMTAPILAEYAAFGDNGLPPITAMKFAVEGEGFRFCLRSQKYFGGLIDDAIRAKYVMPYDFAGITYFRVAAEGTPARFWLIRNFSDDEIDEISKTVSEVNQKAGDAYERLIKKGRMLVMRSGWTGMMTLLQDGQR